MKNQTLNKLRLSLTVMNTLVLIGLSVFIAVVFYASTQISRDTEINNNLEAYCAQLSGEMKDTAASDWASWFSQKSDYSDFQEALKKSNISYVIWDEELAAVSKTDNLAIETKQLKILIQRYFSEGRSGYWIANYRTAEKQIRICTYTTVSTQGSLRVVQVLRDMSDTRNNFSSSIGIVFSVLFFAALASALCGYFLSGRSLVPIKNNMVRQQEFMADASHELRTPIAVIKTNLEVVSSNAESTVSSQQEWIDNAYSETQRMHQIVEDLMFLARADAGEVQENWEKTDVDFLCAEVTERMLTVAMKKEITLIAEVTGEMILVNGDRSQLTQLLVILLDNAIKYSDAGTFVRVKSEKKESHAIIRVIDQGIGIPAEEREKIFDRFYRIDKARSRAEGGTGLGLPIAKWITERHGGTISVKDAQGKRKIESHDLKDRSSESEVSSAMHTGTVMEVVLPLFIQEVISDKMTETGETK